MKSCARAFAPFVVATLLLGACVNPRIVPDEPRIVSDQALGPFDAREECLHLEPGDRVDYRFESNEPIDFNFHYHEGATVVMPLSREKVLEDSGIFAPRIAHDYCLMWEAGPAGAVLTYRIHLRTGS